jgi:hypothetical protein
MNKLIAAAIFSIAATSASAKDILYPREACAEIMSAEYSTGGADTSWSQFEILCRSADGRYTVFVTSWATPAGFLGFGRVSHETQINLIPYDGRELRVR